MTLTWVTTALVPQITTQIGFGHLARIGAAQRAGAHHVAGPGEIGADRVEEAGIFLGVAQPVDAVALHQPHRAGVVSRARPSRCRALPRRAMKCSATRSSAASQLSFLPGALALGAGAHQRLQQPVGMVDALGIARDLGADDAGRVAVVPWRRGRGRCGAVEDLDLERAGRRAVMRTGRMADPERWRCWFMRAKLAGSRAEV